MKCLNVLYLNKQKFPDHCNDSLFSIILLFITKCICLDRIQYHVSLFEHQIMLCILANPLILQSRPISQTGIVYSQKSPMLVNSVCHCWLL